jgi:peroxiredoxin family protein
MGAKPLFILLCSGEHEKIQMTAMIASVAAVSERSVTILVTMNALAAFEKGLDRSRRYKGGNFSKLMIDKEAPDAFGLLGQGKALGDLRIHVCSMALDIHGWTLDNLADDLFDGELGLTRFLSDAEAGDLVTM